MTTLFTTKFSADSPPFNPRTPNTNNNNSRSSSPVAGGAPSSAAGISSSYCSNAIPKYTFPYGDDGTVLEIRNVWAENVEAEMAEIRTVVETYHYIAMDTEFPGIVAKPVTESYSPDYHYKSMKVNVDLLKIIQLGLSFADADGNFAPGCPCWQFNFRFDLEGDMFAQDSIDLLQNSGISFEDHAKRGIDPHLFGELLTVSGMVLDDRVKWVSFHSGYDYGYLLKLLTTVDLPNDEKSFFELLKIYFPTIYDIKYMTSLLDGHQFMGGLQKLADDLKCQRLGAEHQAGSDSLLTMSTFFALVKTAKFRTWDESKYANELFGYGTNHTVRKQQVNNSNAAVVVVGGGGHHARQSSTGTAGAISASAADAGTVFSSGSSD
jgi:CCR4-NOT transcription complex subunit 7/8